MEDKKKDEITKRDRFKIWVYIGFVILGILLLVLLIGLFYYLFSSSNGYKSNTTIVSSSAPKTTTSSLPIMTSQTYSPNDRSSYMSSLFRRGGGFKNRLKRY